MRLSSLKSPAMLLAVAALLATQPGASCVSDNDGRTGGGTNYPPPETQGGRPIPVDPEGIPRWASIVAEGRGDISWRADADGDLYVQDLRREQIVVEHRVHRGERVTVTPSDNHVRIDDNTIYRDDLKSDDVHRIYIDRDHRFEDAGHGPPPRDDNWHHVDGGDGHNDNWHNDNGHGDNDHPRADDHSHDAPLPRYAVPSGAKLIERERNKEISFTAAGSGRAYVFNEDAGLLVGSVVVGPHQHFILSPGRHRATVEGRDALNDERTIDSKTTYSVYFARD